MNIEFNWASQPHPEDQKAVEIEISQLLVDRDIMPCHSGAVSVTLFISGPLETILQGTVKCQCGKTLVTFKGDNRATNVVFTEYD